MQRVAVLLVAVVTGCTLGEGGSSIGQGELRQLVVQPSDLPRVFVRFDEGRQIMADSPGGTRADPDRFDRIDGWKARFRRGGTRQTVGPLVIESRVDLFESAGGAEEDFDAARGDLGESGLGWKPIDEPGLGDESFAATFVQGGFGAVRHYLVFWRNANATVLLNANGFDGKLALAEVLELARKQQRRIARAGAS